MFITHRVCDQTALPTCGGGILIKHRLRCHQGLTEALILKEKRGDSSHHFLITTLNKSSPHRSFLGLRGDV